MAAHLVQQIEAANTVLRELEERDAVAHKAVSSAQRRNLQAQLSRTHLDVVALAEVVKVLRDARFAAEDLEELQRSVATAATAETPGSCSPNTGAQKQNYETCLEFLPATVWDHNGDKQFGTALMKFLVCELKLRKPTEPTSQLVSCALQLGVEGFERAIATPPAV